MHHRDEAVFRLVSDKLVHDLATLEKEDRRNPADVEFLRCARMLVNVHFVNLDLAFELVGQCVDGRSQGFAGAAPFRPEINHGQALATQDFGVEVVVGRYQNIF